MASRKKSVTPVRERILNAAFELFMERGYAGTNTREIAARAKVSKRELYAQFDNKKALLTAGIAARAKRMRTPAELPPPTNRNELTATLRMFGELTLRELTGPIVVAVYRLALSETARSPEVAEILYQQGREANHRALSELIERAQSLNLVRPGDPRRLAERFLALLAGDLLLRLLLGVEKQPSSGDIRARAADATLAFLTLHAR